MTRILANSPAGAVSIRHRLRGPNRAAATACAAGADSIGDAFHLIRAGDADVMVAGGTEACVDAVALGAFGRCAMIACIGLIYMPQSLKGQESEPVIVACKCSLLKPVAPAVKACKVILQGALTARSKLSLVQCP